jgi:hypothetical protein
MRTTTFAALLIASAACAAPPAPKKTPPRKVTPKKAPAKKAAPKTPTAARAQPAVPQSLVLGSISAAVPGNWTAQPAGGQFRFAQYAIPKAPGDAVESLFIVFYFDRGGGGTVDDNLKRWIGMMRRTSEGGGEVDAKVERTERAGLKITTLDQRGTYLERAFPMAQEFTPRPDYRMLAAVIETTGENGEGPYFVRLVGPAKSVTAAKPGWDAFVASLKVP